LTTIRANIPTIKKMAKFSFTFYEDNFDLSQNFLIFETIALLEYLAREIDNLPK